MRLRSMVLVCFVALFVIAAVPAVAAPSVVTPVESPSLPGGSNADYIKQLSGKAEQGNVLAQRMLGVVYLIGLPRDLDKALFWLQKASDQGDAKSSDMIAHIYLDGDGVAKNETTAIRWMHIAMKQGSVPAQTSLGLHALAVEPPDYPLAHRLLLQSAAHDDINAITALGFIYQTGAGVSVDFSAAFQWFSKAAQLGGDIAMNKIGDAYRKGLGTEPDGKKALGWYLKAIAAGNEDAEVHAAVMLKTGEGVPRDPARALQIYRAGAEKGHAWAQCLLGNHYLEGSGVKQSDTEAARLLGLSAQQGNLCGQGNLGELYYMGRGVPRDDVKAVNLFRLASAQNSSDARYNLGRCYENGRGVAKNLVVADALYRLATADGTVPDAPTAVARVEGGLSTAELQRAVDLQQTFSQSPERFIEVLDAYPN